MRIEPFKRVVYEHNPLAEVVCQIRFESVGELAAEVICALKSVLSDYGYSGYQEEISLSFAPQVVNVDDVPQIPIVLPHVRIHHFVSEDESWRASICPDFLALTCLKYTKWSDFFERFIDILTCAAIVVAKAVPIRIGLRYKDVIDRETLGLTSVPWHELIAPFLLGPTMPNALANGQAASESDVDGFFSQTTLRLENSKVLLQSSLLTTIDGQKRAFLIDADFYIDEDISENLTKNIEVLKCSLDSLHANASALFRRGITERLHDALHPIE